MFIYRLFCFVIGLILATTGMIFFTLYLPLLNYGFAIGEFIGYILKIEEIYLLPFGLSLMILSLFGTKFWAFLEKIKVNQQRRGHVLK